MKKILFCTVMMASLFFVACTKTAPVTPPAPKTNANPIVGLWVGTYQLDDAAYLGTFYYSYNLFADSTLIQQGGGTDGVIWTGAGTWSLKGTAWSATIANTEYSQGHLTQNITAKYDSVAGTLSNGVWVYTSGGNKTGTFSLKRVQ